MWLNEAIHEAWKIALVGMRETSVSDYGTGGPEGDMARELVWQYSCVVILVDVVPAG